ncbi:MAG TPA: phage capsid protein, partial [Verrucomicrobium sp.]|nr:phage capsid protein [Verrucomicrobium sp.]
MPLDTTQFYTTEFENNWTHVAQQKETRLLEAVTRDDFTGKRKWYNQLNVRTMQPVTTRKGDTPDGDTSGEKYWNYQQKWEDVITFDEDDDIQLGDIVLPTSAEVMNQAMALNRTIDQTVVDAFFAT